MDSIVYNEDLQVIICKVHSIAVKGEAIARHVSDSADHSREDNRAVRELLEQWQAEGKVFNGPEEVATLLNNTAGRLIRLIPELEVVPGWQCVNCGRLFSGRKLATNHVKSEHAVAGTVVSNNNNDVLDSRSREVSARAVRVQAIYGRQCQKTLAMVRESTERIDATDGGRRLPSVAVGDDHPLAQLQARFARQIEAIQAERVRQLGRIHPAANEQDTPWLKDTGILTFLPEDVHEVAAMVNADTHDLGEYAGRFKAVDERMAELRELCNIGAPEAKLNPVAARLVSQLSVENENRCFRGHLLAETNRTYRARWQRLLAYVVRCKTKGATHFTAVHVVPDHDDLVDLSVKLTQQLVTGNHFQSPILGFVACLSIVPESRRFVDPNHLTAVVASLLHGMRLWTLHCAWTTGNGDGAEVGVLAERYLYKDKFYPAGHLLGVWASLSRAVRRYIADRSALWSLDAQTVTYDGVALNMAHLTKLFNHVKAEAMMKLQKLFFNTPLPVVMLDQLKDCLREGAGTSFVHDNPQLNQRHLVDLLTGDTDLVRQAFVPDGSTLATSWKGQYEQDCQEFLLLMAVAIHLSAGGPMRGVELMSTTWQRTNQGQRGVRIMHELVAIVTYYHKSASLTRSHNNTVRFLTRDLSVMLVQFLGFVQPFREVVHSTPDQPKICSPYLFTRFGGDNFTTDHLTRKLKECCALAGVPVFTVQQFRQIQTAIVKRHFHEEAVLLDQHEDDEEDSLGATIMRQSNHSASVAATLYANSAANLDANLWDGVVSKSLAACRAVQWFHGYETSDSTGRHVQVERHRRALTREQLRKKAARLMGDKNLRWKSPAQEQTALAVANHTERRVLSILPTGGGKSLPFMLASHCQPNSTVVVVVPFVVLKSDLHRRCEELGLSVCEWPTLHQSGVLLVSAETVSSDPGFLQHCRLMIHLQRLECVVLDECHLAITQADFRESLRRLYVLSELPVTTLYLTATMPPTWEAEFKVAMQIESLKVHRQPTNRPNLKYVTRSSPIQSDASFLIHCAEAIRQQWLQLNPGRDDRGMVICRTKTAVATVASLIGCPSTTGDDTPEERRAKVAAWMSGAAHRLIVGTTALGTGLDYRAVRLVAHAGVPYGIVEYAQEAGRAGRDDKPATSLVIHQDKASFGQPGQGQLFHDSALQMDGLLRDGNVCIRQHLSAFLDGQQSKNCRLQPADTQLCSRCQVKADREGDVYGDDVDVQVMEQLAAAAEAGPPAAPVTPADTSLVQLLTSEAPFVIPSSSSSSSIRSVVPDTPTHFPRRGRSVNPVFQPATSTPAFKRRRVEIDLVEYRRFLNNLANAFCPCCRLGGDTIRHEYEDCLHRESIDQSYSRGRNIENHMACFNCWQPLDVCWELKRGNPALPCTYPRLIHTALYGLWTHKNRQLKERLPETAAMASIRDFFNWAMQTKDNFLSTKCINAFYVLFTCQHFFEVPL